jgi:hypothetical protein
MWFLNNCGPRRMHKRHGSRKCASFCHHYIMRHIFHTDSDYDHLIHDTVYYSMVENKELFFFLNACQKTAFMRNDSILRVCSFFALHKKSKNCGTRFLKYCLFKNLGSWGFLREFFKLFFIKYTYQLVWQDWL